MLVDCRRSLPVSHRLLVLTLRRAGNSEMSRTNPREDSLWTCHTPDQSPSVDTASSQCVRPREQPQELIVSYLEWNPGFHAWQQVSLSGPNTLGHLTERRLGSPSSPGTPSPNLGNCLCTEWVARTSWILEVFMWSQARTPGSISPFLKCQTRS